MCGIAGSYGECLDDRQVKAVTALLLHRGPDQQAAFLDPRASLLHTRLSIIDLSDLASQPFHFEQFVLVFNGEVYNYQEVRKELQDLGHSFVSNSDTEVIIQAFSRWKEKCVDRFIGMFAFAVYDRRQHELWLFRDRLGVKPLYYTISNGTLMFASELRALLHLSPQRDLDRDATYAYFRFGFIHGSHSIFKNIRKLEPGHYARMTSSGFTAHRYWSLPDVTSVAKSDEQWVEELHELMISAFRYRMVADVPVGVFLSGGIDSSLLSAVLKHHYGDVSAFSIGFKEKQFDESAYAEDVASQLGIHHVTAILGLDEARGVLEKFYDIYDEPFADTSGIPTSVVAKLAKDHGMKVVLSADGGDELFGGYTHYAKARSLYRRMRSLPRTMRRGFVKQSRKLLASRADVYAFNLEHKIHATEELLLTDNVTGFFEAYIANQSQEELVNLIHYTAGYLSNALPGEPREQMMRWDITHYLPEDLLVKVDRATMFHGIECREPILDHRLVAMAMSMPIDMKFRNGKGKYALRRILEYYFPVNYFDRPKKGFRIPLFHWFSTDLDQMFAERFNSTYLKRISCLDAGEVLKEYKKYLYYKAKGKEYNIEKMWRILSFILWWEKYMEHGT